GASPKGNLRQHLCGVASCIFYPGCICKASPQPDSRGDALNRQRMCCLTRAYSTSVYLYATAAGLRMGTEKVLLPMAATSGTLTCSLPTTLPSLSSSWKLSV